MADVRALSCDFCIECGVWRVKINCGKMRWYKLKDKKLMAASQGSIQLECDLVFNHVRSARLYTVSGKK